MFQNYIILILFLGLTFESFGYKWQRGLYQIDQIDPGIRFSKFGESAIELSTSKMPLEFAQLAKFSTDDSANVFFRISTGILGKWGGPGNFSIEAFDHSWVEPWTSDKFVDEFTRTILYFDKGLLFVNAESLGKDSFIIIETPIGKVISYGGVFSLELEEFEDGNHRNAYISCYSGSLVYTDQNETKNTLNSGNKIQTISKDGLFKFNLSELDELEQRAVVNFKKESECFIVAGIFPKAEAPKLNKSLETVGTKTDIRVRSESFYFPVLEHTKSFNPYKKYYGDD